MYVLLNIEHALFLLGNRLTMDIRIYHSMDGHICHIIQLLSKIYDK